MAINKFYVLDAKPEEEIYKLDFIKYLQLHQANTAYQIKKLLDFKQHDYEFKQKLIESVQKVEQEFKKQYAQ